VLALRIRRCYPLLLEPVDEFVGAYGSADVVALDRVAAERVQLLPGGRVLDPSATTRRPRLRPRSTVDRTITASRRLLVICAQTTGQPQIETLTCANCGREFQRARV
jgi:hypothetical protein